MDASLADIEWRTIVLGPLPIMTVNRCLGLELRAGDVMFTADAQKHAFGKKPERYSICNEHCPAVISAPTHIGQQPGYESEGFDLVKIVDDGPIILMGIGLHPTKKGGFYTVQSIYPIDRNTLQRRIRVGTTRIV
jgi:hypothetical protein